MPRRSAARSARRHRWPGSFSRPGPRRSRHRARRACASACARPPNHDHARRPFIRLTADEADKRRTPLSRGAATHLSSHAGGPRGGDGRRATQRKPVRPPRVDSDRESARTAEAIVPAIEPDDRYSGIARRGATDVAASRCRRCDRSDRRRPLTKALTGQRDRCPCKAGKPTSHPRCLWRRAERVSRLVCCRSAPASVRRTARSVGLSICAWGRLISAPMAPARSSMSLIRTAGSSSTATRPTDKSVNVGAEAPSVAVVGLGVLASPDWPGSRRTARLGRCHCLLRGWSIAGIAAAPLLRPSQRGAGPGVYVDGPA